MKTLPKWKRPIAWALVALLLIPVAIVSAWKKYRHRRFAGWLITLEHGERH
jgi:hypothetical protein